MQETVPKKVRWMPESQILESKLKHTYFVVFCSCLVLTACGGNTKSTLGQLKYEQQAEEVIEFENLTHEEVRAEYKELLDVFEDEKLKENIERRIADVYMIESDQVQDLSNELSSYYVDAIKAYRNILERYPNSPDNAEVLYQLAKAYDLEGQQDEAQAMLIELTTRHPAYANNAEAYFRLGDIYFGNKDYSSAANSYLSVTQLTNEKLKLNAHYMLGWSQYKLLKFRSSAESFAFVLSELLGEKDTTSQLDKRDSAVAEDALHSLSLALDKIGGAEAISLIGGLDQQPYAWLIYENIGDYYHEKELYERATESYRAYLSSNPLSARGPQFHQRIIQTYADGGFPKQALEEKYKFVQNFGVRSVFLKTVGADQDTLSLLKIYLDELARHNYAEGLAVAEQKEELSKLEKTDDQKLLELSNHQIQSFSKAASFYGEYLETFPDDERFDEIVFLQSEAYFVVGQYNLAVKGYEHVAYSPNGESAVEHAADAGYSAIISYQKYIESLNRETEEAKLWQAQAVDSMLRFSETYHGDSRSPEVLTNAAEYLFSLDKYQQAIDIGLNLLEGNTTLDNELAKTALGIVAHSYFKLEDFANAQKYYYSQRGYSDEDGEEYQNISERLASTTYKLSETLLHNQQSDSAITELLNIKKWTPDSPVRVIAQYDAATLMMENKYWDRAILELKELIMLYPEHQLADEFPRKLAFSYRSNEEWSEAAESYIALHENDRDVEIRREALFSAAEMFEQNMSYDTAIMHFKSYAYQYEEPFDMRMEARYKLAINYERIADNKKSRYWMRRIIDGDTEAGSARTERSRWLASWAQNEYGDYHANEFREVQLNLPLAKSIARKQEALALATQRYEKSAELGFLEFVTQSSYKIAELYSELASDVRESPRPSGLSKVDMETYERVLREQSQPLNGVSIELHLANIERAWEGLYNDWIQQSFDALTALYPERFAKEEILSSYGNEIR